MLPQAPNTKHQSVWILYEVHRPTDTEVEGAAQVWLRKLAHS